MSDERSILLVEDDVVDQMLVKRAFKDLGITSRLEIAVSGEDALLYLRDPRSERPGIILLDLNMPRMSGLELLGIIKKDEALRSIPVIALTTSQEAHDRETSYLLGVAGYMVKTVEYPAFVELIRTLDDYWKLSER
jgi:CheY-like chemotaxis protein